ncbi:MAG: hypothetical protein K8R35_10370 [Bacteroidales bacterium]|nr:hypothetical protein [Bacteroidales bacterium]
MNQLKIKYKQINPAIKILILLFLSMFSSCDEMVIYDCNDCVTTEPTSCDLTILTDKAGSPYSEYHVDIYQGRVEDGIIISSFTSLVSASIEVSLNLEYTGVSTIEISGNTYRSINSVTPRAKELVDYCAEPCYVIKDNVLDLKLKHY